MAKSITKSLRSTNLLNWIGDTFGGAIGTRHCRIQWSIVRKDPVVPTILLEVRGSAKNQESQNIVREAATYLSREFHHGNGSIVDVTGSKVTLTASHFEGKGSTLSFNDMINHVEKMFGWNQKCKLARAKDLKKENIVVEFGSPNIAKPFHMGHLRSIVTGHFVENICVAAGHNVKSICFLGDWGTQFGILQAGLLKTYPDHSSEKLAQMVQQLTLGDLLNIYVDSVKLSETSQEFSRMALAQSSALEQGNKDNLVVWNIIRAKTIEHLNSLWELLGIKFELIQGESEFAVKCEEAALALELLDKLKLTCKTDDNCTLANLYKDEKFPQDIKVPLVKADGSSLYLLRDIACAMSRFAKLKPRPDKMLYVVDITQGNHFFALFRLLAKLGYEKNLYSSDKWNQTLRHVKFGKISGMSTRSGNFVLLSEVIESGRQVMQNSRLNSPNTRNIDDSEITDQIVISALKAHSLKSRRHKAFEFRWEDALRSTGDTGVKLQYTHARLCSLEEKCEHLLKLETNFEPKFFKDNKDAVDLLIHLLNFEDVFWASYSELEPCILLTYLFKLCDKTSKGLKTMPVLVEPNQTVAASTLKLFMLSKKVLATGLKIIGIQPLNKM